MEAVPGAFAVAVDQIGHLAPLGVDPLAELDALGHIGRLLLGQGPEEGQHELALPQGVHPRREKQGLDAQGLQPPHALEQVHRVAGQAGDVLDHQHLEEAPLRVRHHLLELDAAADLGAGEALVGVEPDQGVAGALGVLDEKALLGLQTAQLVGLVRGDPAVGGDVHGVSPSFAASFG